ncbi:hypothetical protein F4703DRAFT_1788087 [Phycomyces blakesleeanus]
MPLFLASGFLELFYRLCGELSGLLYLKMYLLFPENDTISTRTLLYTCNQYKSKMEDLDFNSNWAILSISQRNSDINSNSNSKSENKHTKEKPILCLFQGISRNCGGDYTKNKRKK